MCLELAVLRDMKNKALLRLIHFLSYLHTCKITDKEQRKTSLYTDYHYIQITCKIEMCSHRPLLDLFLAALVTHK